jgi:ABC-type uncharacterized transport system fused permease/ATPase subunit
LARGWANPKKNENLFKGFLFFCQHNSTGGGFFILKQIISMIENYFVILVTHLKSLVGNIVGMTHAIFKIETNVKKIYFFFSTPIYFVTQPNLNRKTDDARENLHYHLH